MGGMTRRVLLLVGLAALAAGQERGTRRASQAQRDAWQKPDEVIRLLGIGPQDVVADIGAGDGYFARRFAQHARKVYAVDIDARALEAAAKGAPANLVTIVATPTDPKLPAGEVHLVFFCNTLHHISRRPDYLRNLARALAPGGRIVNIDFHKKPLPVGPGVDHKLAEEEALRDFEAAGYRLVEKHDLLPYQYFQVFALPHP
jgi:ubiquinone/menaquinone biosynthesis C-methylase UbiE